MRVNVVYILTTLHQRSIIMYYRPTLSQKTKRHYNRL